MKCCRYCKWIRYHILEYYEGTVFYCYKNDYFQFLNPMKYTCNLFEESEDY